MDPTLLQAAHELHLTALRRLRRSPWTLHSYRIYCGAFLRFVDERRLSPALTSLNRDVVEQFQDYVRARSMGSRDGAAAERQSIRVVKTWSRWLWKRGFFEHDPLARIDLPRLAKLHRLPYTQAEARRLAAAAEHCHRPVFARALLLVILDTGCRIGELRAADVEDLDLSVGAITFRHAKGGHVRRVVFGVSTAIDGGPCLAALRAWLEVRLALHDEHALFTSKCGDRATYKQLHGLWARLGKSAGVSNCIPHRGRHTHASELLAELPGAETQLRQRLGHLSTEVLADYVTVTERAARQIADVASLSAKWAL